MLVTEVVLPSLKKDEIIIIIIIIKQNASTLFKHSETFQACVSHAQTSVDVGVISKPG